MPPNELAAVEEPFDEFVLMDIEEGGSPGADARLAQLLDSGIEVERYGLLSQPKGVP